MKKRQIILIHFILAISVINSTPFLASANYSSRITPRNIEDNVKRNTKNEDDDKNQINNKKILKKEIQNRKKYHKTLLNMYNKNFDENYLKLITDNSLKIQELEKLV